MLTKVSTFVDDVEMVMIGRRAAVGFNDTGEVLEIDDTDGRPTAMELVRSVIETCREHAVKHGDGWYQATYVSAEREIKPSRARGEKKEKARATLGVFAFPVGDEPEAGKNSGKAAIESEAAVAIRAISDFTTKTLERLGEQVVNISKAAGDLITSQVETNKQIAAQQKGYVTQGETLVELVRMSHAHQLAIAEAEEESKRMEALIGVAKDFGLEWAKANLFAKPSAAATAAGWKPDPSKPDNVNILASVLMTLTEAQREGMIGVVGRPVYDVWMRSIDTTTDLAFKSVLLETRDHWADKTEDDMKVIGTQLAQIVGIENFAKIYTVLREIGIAEG